MEEQYQDLQTDNASAPVCPDPTCNASCPVHCPRYDNRTTRRRRRLPAIPNQEPPVSAYLHKRQLPYVDEAERQRRIALVRATMPQEGSRRRDNWLQQISLNESMANRFNETVDFSTSDDSSSEYDRYMAAARFVRRVQKNKKRSPEDDKKEESPP